VGLGNPGPEFADTRHNLGFRCVDLIARRCGATWQHRSGLSAKLAVAHPNEHLALVLGKPQTYMNRSGNAVRDLLDALTLDTTRAMVVYDDMDLPFGALRLRERGSAGTHNGMRSVVTVIGTDVPRLRIGIGQAQPGGATDHVLGEFSPDEQDEVDKLIERAAGAVLDWAELGANVAMNRYNKT
jgi:peptidyl-tRNA hydrolase, PTH1 family